MCWEKEVHAASPPGFGSHVSAVAGLGTAWLLSSLGLEGRRQSAWLAREALPLHTKSCGTAGRGSGFEVVSPPINQRSLGLPTPIGALRACARGKIQKKTKNKKKRRTLLCASPLGSVQPRTRAAVAKTPITPSAAARLCRVLLPCFECEQQAVPARGLPPLPGELFSFRREKGAVQKGGTSRVHRQHPPARGGTAAHGAGSGRSVVGTWGVLGLYGEPPPG